MLTMKDQFYLSAQKNNMLFFESDVQKMYFCVYVLEEKLFRVTLTKEQPEMDIHTWAVAPGDTEMPFEGLDRNRITDYFSLPAYETSEHPEEYVIETASLKLVINKTKLHCSWFDKTAGEEKLIAEDRNTQAYGFQVAETAPTAHYLKRNEGERYYGLGEKTGNVNKHGERYRMLNIDAMGYDAQKTDPLYKHIPYYITHSPETGVAYGLYYDDYNECAFDMGREKDNYHGKYRFFQSSSHFLDCYFILGPTVAEVTRSFSWMTGRPALMPKWSIGYSGSTMTYTDEEKSQERLMNFVEDCQRHDMPCESFHLSSGYTSIDHKRYVFNWNYEKFPDPVKFTEDFHANGVRIIANIKPSLLIDHPKHEEVLNNDYIILDNKHRPLLQQFWDDMGVYLDFTNKQTIEWWKENVKKELLANGIDATWNDNNEFEIWDPEAVIHLFGQGGKFQEYRAIFPMLMTKSSLEAQTEFDSEKRPYLISRAGSAGLSRYAQTWTGDNYSNWETLQYNIKMAIGLSLSGIYNFGHDTGGFSGDAPDSELFLRWIQSNIYYPRFTIHSWNDDQTVNEPWMYPEIIDKVSDTIHWHQKLSGYIFSLLHKSSASYEPVIKPTFFDFGDDAATHAENDEFMLGEELLVCTIVRPGERERELYLPDNPHGWYDMYTEQWYAGGRKVTVPAPLEYTPVMVKGGSLVPIENKVENRIDMQLYPGRNGEQTSFTYYDDNDKRHDADVLSITCTMMPDESGIYIDVLQQGSYSNGLTAVHFQLPEDETRQVFINGKADKWFSWK
ncbi:glycoside hydrolase family 31 protein [Marinococcus luteus]|uniref:glycoside hydrolase family 31 protein n=1 Tax=Marinococcus luteus TaxID=1122204 RepID=UPI002ACC5EE0|nr:glycoside hydrolase family 31 protein [Marinococcus luteus]MDZ5781980.1 glycoside hydrolase family 31 protein [Marinococcus luteus]